MTRKPKSEKHVKETLRRSIVDQLREEIDALKAKCGRQNLEIAKLRREKSLVEDELSFERNFSYRMAGRALPN